MTTPPQTRPGPTRRRFLRGLGVLGAIGVASSSICAGARALGRHAPTTVRWPGEHEPHLATLISWPHRRGFYGFTLDRMQDEIAATARAIAQFEPVLVIAHPGHGATAAAHCGPTVRVIEERLNDCWVRDNGPVFVHADRGLGPERVALDFGFNAWGNPNWAHADDDALPTRLCHRYGEPVRDIPFVLEGGAIHGDGEGTVYTTEECLLHPSRNGQVTKAQVEAELAVCLGAQKVVWLPWGLTPNDLTEGHIDGVLAVIEPGKVFLQSARATDSQNVRQRAAENLAALQGQTDARGRAIQIVQWPWLTDCSIWGSTFEHTYLNFYLCNGGVVVPTAGSPDDAPALAALQLHFPNRTVVGVESRALGYNGGGTHCITQQVPL